MASGLEVVLAESVAGKEDYLIRVGVEIVSWKGTSEFGLCIGDTGL